MYLTFLHSYHFKEPLLDQLQLISQNYRLDFRVDCKNDLVVSTNSHTPFNYLYILIQSKALNRLKP